MYPIHQKRNKHTEINSTNVDAHKKLDMQND